MLLSRARRHALSRQGYCETGAEGCWRSRPLAAALHAASAGWSKATHSAAAASARTPHLNFCLVDAAEADSRKRRHAAPAVRCAARVSGCLRCADAAAWLPIMPRRAKRPPSRTGAACGLLAAQRSTAVPNTRHSAAPGMQQRQAEVLFAARRVFAALRLRAAAAGGAALPGAGPSHRHVVARPRRRLAEVRWAPEAETAAWRRRSAETCGFCGAGTRDTAYACGQPKPRRQRAAAHVAGMRAAPSRGQEA